MDIEFIQEKDRENIFKLMEVCGLQMSEAYQLYLNAGSSFQGAMQMHFNKGSQPNVQSLQPSSWPEQVYPYQDQNQNGFEGDEFDRLYEKYKIYISSRTKFHDRYEVRKQSGFLHSFIPRIFKTSEESTFKKQFEKYLGKTSEIKFITGSLTSVLESSDKFPILVYVLDFGVGIKQKILQLTKSPYFIEISESQYKNFGLGPTYEIEKSIERFVDRKKNNNCLLVLRVNAVQQIEVLKRIPIQGTQIKQICNILKLTKNDCISLDLDDEYLQKRYASQLMGDFDYVKPMSIAQRRKMAQDRQLKKKQEAQFFDSMKKDLQKTQKQKIPNKIQNKSSQFHNPQKKVEQIKQINIPVPTKPKKNLSQERRKIRQKLKEYTQGMAIKLRFPNGESQVLTVDFNEKCQYLYDFINGLDKDIGFEKDEERNFDIIRPYDRLTLEEHLGQTFKVVFEESQSENLVVSEK